MEESSKKKKLIAAGVLAFIILAGISLSVTPSSDSVAVEETPTPTADSTPDSTGPASSPEATAATSASPYKNGTYKASGTYRTPESTETIDVTLTINDGKVVSSSVSLDPEHRTSAYYQNQFSGNYKAYVEGRSLDSIQLSRVSGSSLTSGGFNKALEAIKNQAKA